MPSTQAGLPFTGRTPDSLKASRDGARVAERKASSQAAKMLRFYAQHGELTDRQMAKLMGTPQQPFPESRVSARRSLLMKDGLVTSAGLIAGPFGALNTLWRLTAQGSRLAATV